MDKSGYTDMTSIQILVFFALVIIENAIAAIQSHIPSTGLMVQVNITAARIKSIEA